MLLNYMMMAVSCIVPFVVFLYPNARAYDVIASTMDEEKTPISKKLLAWLPYMSNTMILEKLYGAADTTKILGLLNSVLMVIVLLIRFFVGDVVINLFATYAVFLVAGLSYTQWVYLTYQLVITFDASDMLWTCIVPPFGMYMITNKVKPFYYDNRDEILGTFEGE